MKLFFLKTIAFIILAVIQSAQINAQYIGRDSRGFGYALDLDTKEASLEYEPTSDFLSTSLNISAYEDLQYRWYNPKTKRYQNITERFHITKITRITGNHAPNVEVFTIPNSVTSLGSISRFPNLRTVDIPNSVETIGSFSYCESLESLSIPGSVNYVGSFSNCENLKSLTIPSGATYFGGCSNCPNLEEIHLANTIESLGSFNGCPKLTQITLPSNLKEIGANTFQGCNLESITIDGDIVVVGNYAFSGCSKLSSVKCGSNVQEIGKYAFANCTSLQNIELSTGLLSIGEKAFSGCSMSSIVIPGSVSSLGYRVFDNSNLIQLRFEDGDGNLTINGLGCSNLQILETGNSVKRISGGSASASEFRNLNEVHFGEGLEYVGGFSNCDMLKELVLPASLKEMSENAFKSCDSIESLTLGGGEQPLTIPQSAFQDCKQLKSVTLKEGIGEIATQAFYDCCCIDTLSIPSSVTIIGSHAFSGCSGLVEVEIGIGEGNMTIDHDAFGSSIYNHSPQIKNLTIGDAVTEINSKAFYDNTMMESLTLGNNIKTIGKEAFSSCYRIQTLTIPASVEVIGASAFSRCNSLLELIIEDGHNKKIIGDGAFGGCSSLTSLTLGNSISEVGNKAFGSCQNLEYISLGVNITAIGESAFQCGDRISGIPFNEKLKSLKIPGSVKSISFSAFSGFHSLESLTIGTGVEEIGACAFDECNSLLSLEIPKTVKTIGGAAFRGCYSLESLTLGERIDSIGAEAFLSNDATLGWPMNKNVHFLEIPDKVKTIGNRAFSGMSGLETLIIGNGTEVIGNNAFSNCGSLKSLTVPCNVVEIGDGAFRQCVSLESVSIGNDNLSEESPQIIRRMVHRVGNNIDVVIGRQGIGANAFLECSNLQSLTIGKNVDAIGEKAFYNCPKLESIYCDVPEPIDINMNVFSVQKNGKDVFNSKPTLVVTAGSEQQYDAHPVWKLFNLETQLEIYAYEGLKGKQEVKNESGRVITGVTADGASMLTFALPIEVDEIKEIRVKTKTHANYNILEPDDYYWPQIVEKLDDKKWGFVYTAPSEFPEEITGNEYEEELEAIFVDGNGIEYKAQKKIRILRPGVLLIHGFLSDKSCFANLKDFLIRSGYKTYQIVNHDYKSTHTESFAANTETHKVVQKGIERLYDNLLYTNGIVSHKYDIVGHSMGGILARMYAQKCNRDNEGNSDFVCPINSIITLDTPHSGSQWADLINQFLLSIDNAFASAIVPYKIHYWYNRRIRVPIMSKAWGSLRTSGLEMELLNDKDNLKYEEAVPVHAICSYMTENPDWDFKEKWDNQTENVKIILDAVGTLSGNKMYNEIGNGVGTVSQMIYSTMVHIFQVISNQETIDTEQKFLNWVLKDSKGHDGIVTYKSQRGGLAGPRITNMEAKYDGFFGFDSNAHHCKTNKWNDTFEQIYDLLMRPKNSLSFGTGVNGFHPEKLEELTFNEESNSRSLRANVNSSTNEFIKLNLEQADTARVLNVQIEKSSGIKGVCSFPLLDDNYDCYGIGNENNYTIEIPDNYGGPLYIGAIGITENGEYVFDVDSVYYDYTARLNYMEFEKHDDVMVRIGEELDCKVLGSWSNNDETYVNPEFTTDITGFVRIDGQRIIGAKAGSCMLYASLLGKTDSLWVTVYAMNELTARDTVAFRGTNMSLPVNLQNDDDAVALQFDVEIPEDISLSSVSLSARSDDHIATIQQTEGNKYRITVNSIDSKTIHGNDSILLNLNLQIAALPSATNHTIKMTNINLVTTDNATIRLSDTSCTLLIEKSLHGDANGDGTVDVNDITATVNSIQGDPSTTFVREAADVNGDGIIDVNDITGIVNIIQNQ